MNFRENGGDVDADGKEHAGGREEMAESRFGRSEAWTQLGEKILDAARQELFLSMRYLFEPLNGFEYRRDQRISYLATDGRRLYYNPMRLAARYREDPVTVNRAYLHMVLHGLFRCIYACGEKEREIWDLACDILAEYLIDHIELSAVMQPENQERQRLYEQFEAKCRLMSAENIYEVLCRMPEGERQRLLAAEQFLVDDHSLWYQKEEQDSDEERTRQEKQKDEKKWENAAKKMQTAMTSFGGGRGDSRGSLFRTLAASTHRRISYRDFLRKFAVLRENMQVDLDSFDYGFYHYGLELYGNMPLIEELEYREESGIEDFVIVLDTSGSCAYELIQRFLDTTFEILSGEGSFFEHMNLHIIQCDNQVQEDTVLHTVEEMEQFKESFTVRGFGGTDFRPAFHYIDALQRKGELKRLKGVLYFTDGYGIYPASRPPYETAFVFLSDYDVHRDVPGWAIRVDISETQLKASR